MEKEKINKYNDFLQEKKIKESMTRNFFAGLALMIVGFYLLLKKFTVSSGFGFGYSFYSYNGYSLTTGMIFIPFIIGLIMFFYNSKNIIAWILTLGSFGAMIFGVISSLNIRISTMNSFDFIVILFLSFGGLGLFLRSLKQSSDLDIFKIKKELDKQ